MRSGNTAKSTKPKSALTKFGATSTATTKEMYSSSTVAAPAPKLDHLSDIPLLRRTNSMAQTHGFALGGGIRSIARLSRPEAKPIYTALYYTGVAESASPSDVKKISVKERNRSDDSAIEDEDRLSKEDVEVSVIHDLGSLRFLKYLSEIKIDEVATLEFHGNAGPCNGCKKRINAAIEYLSTRMYKDTELRIYVYYKEMAYEKLRGSGDGVWTLYGYEDGVTKVTYNNYQLYCRDLGTTRGKRNRKAETEALAQAQKSASSGGGSQNTNRYAALIESSDDESD